METVSETYQHYLKIAWISWITIFSALELLGLLV